MKIIDNGFAAQAAVLEKTVRARTGGEGPIITAELAADAGLGKPESFRIDKTAEGWRITGADAAGVLFGIGKFLHTAKWSATTFEPDPPQSLIEPHCSVRAIYAANHFYNWYQMASDEELERYFTELALWGYNTIILHMPFIMCEHLDDEVWKRFARSTKRIFGIARRLGMHTGLVQSPNQGTKDTPDSVRADLSFDRPTRGHAGINVCPSNPEGLAWLKRQWVLLFETFREEGLDCLVAFPYDEGGCGCEKCTPWGANGFVRMNMELRRIAKSYFPNLKIAMGTWTFDEPDDQGEYSGIYGKLRSGEAECEYLMIDSHTDFPEYALTHDPVRPVLDFPEISMWGLYPWGGFGANPMPSRFQRIWNSSKRLLDGGLPYSEGIFEDISKVQFAGYYWDPDRDWHDILREYIAYEADECIADDALTMIGGIEANAVAIGEQRTPDLALAVKTAALARALDERLPQRGKRAWRWRFLYIRALLDEKRYRWFFEQSGQTEEDLYVLRRYSGEILQEDPEAQAMFRELIAWDHAVPDNGSNRWTLPPAVGYADFKRRYGTKPKAKGL